MRWIKHVTFFSAFLTVVLAGSGSLYAQDARLRFDNLDQLGTKASDLVEVNVEGKMLALAKRVLLKVNDKDAQKIGEAIKGLVGIYVRVFNFDKDGQYDMSDIDAIRSQLRAPGWEKLANVRSKKKNQKIDVYTMFEGDIISGVALVLSEDRSVALVNVIGPIDIDTLVELSGHMNIPKFEIENGENN
jgi:hypothetical protein